MGEANRRGNFDQRKAQVLFGIGKDGELLKNETLDLSTNIHVSINWHNLQETDSEELKEARMRFLEKVLKFANFINQDLPRVLLDGIAQANRAKRRIVVPGNMDN